jgi:hypothetical protein
MYHQPALFLRIVLSGVVMRERFLIQRGREDDGQINDRPYFSAGPGGSVESSPAISIQNFCKNFCFDEFYSPWGSGLQTLQQLPAARQTRLNQSPSRRFQPVRSGNVKY